MTMTMNYDSDILNFLQEDGSILYVYSDSWLYSADCILKVTNAHITWITPI